MNKKGLTLLELMIYIALAAFLLAPMIMLMNNSSKNMTRNTVSADLRMSGRDILNIMHDDIRNAGFKLHQEKFCFHTAATYLKPEGTGPFYGGSCGCKDAASNGCDPEAGTGSPVKPGTKPIPVSSSIPATKDWDGSSFKYSPVGTTPNDSADTLKFRTGNLNDDQAQEVTYSVSGGKLTRAVTGGATQTLATNVTALKFQFSKDAANWVTSTIRKNEVRYIKVIVVLRDPKKLAAAKNVTIEAAGWTRTNTDLALYERHEIVIPIPNNGLYPPCPTSGPWVGYCYDGGVNGGLLVGQN